MTELNFNLHPAQLEIFTDPARFKVVVAGRRFGKSYLSGVVALIEALKNKNEKGYDLKNTDVYYVAPTFQQGKDIMWRLLKDFARDVTESVHENTGVLRLINGRQIHIKGSDRPDNLRGVGLSFVVMDEYASMKPETWDMIIAPTLADVEGGALFIGTPAGKNHFYNLYQSAHKWEDWKAFEFKTIDNPYIKAKEVERARSTMTHEAFKQEHEASFSAGSGSVFNVHTMVEVEADYHMDGFTYMTVDPAGYEQVNPLKMSKNSNLDETAIAITTVGQDGWLVEDILTGRWGIRETSLQILRAYQKFQPMVIGIEKGSLMNALMPYLQDQSRRLRLFPNIQAVTHGNKKKQERIVWALQGRLQNERLYFKPFKNLNKFKDQLMDFPNPLSHDDMLDALAYIDQISKPIYHQHNMVIDTYEPIDNYSGI